MDKFRILSVLQKFQRGVGIVDENALGLTRTEAKDLAARGLIHIDLWNTTTSPNMNKCPHPDKFLLTITPAGMSYLSSGGKYRTQH